MKSYHGLRQQLIRQVQEEFNQIYPFLKIEFLRQEPGSQPAMDGEEVFGEDAIRDGARNLLEKDIRLTDSMKVGELEAALKELFGGPALVLRRSGNFWMETRMSRDWTLKQQNDHGEDITSAFL